MFDVFRAVGRSPSAAVSLMSAGACASLTIVVLGGFADFA